MRRAALLTAALAALATAAPVWASPVASGTVAMDDAVELTYDLYEPAGAAPATGWPAVVVQHGLGGSKESLAPVAEIFAAQGYAALAYTARGHGSSGGDVGLAGPREVADTQRMVAWLRARPEVSDTQLGCWGISYGGGQCWNAAPAGLFDAIAVVETWTDLYAALWPQNVAKTGVIGGLATLVSARSPLIRNLQADAVAGSNPGAIRPLAAERSILPRIGSVRTPVYLFQGRQDFAFDLGQATRAFAALTGPKKLYVGAFGHFPSTFPGADVDYVFGQSVAWFDRFVKGQPNGADGGPTVAVADRTGTRRASYAGLPKTKTVAIAFRGSAGTRIAPRLGRAVETFGQSTVRVQVRRVSPTFRRLVAVVTAGGKVVTHGAVVPRRGANTIRLGSYTYYLPKGTRLTLRLGADSGAADITFARLTLTTSGSIRLGPATLALQTLPAPVSR